MATVSGMASWMIDDECCDLSQHLTVFEEEDVKMIHKYFVIRLIDWQRYARPRHYDVVVDGRDANQYNFQDLSCSV